MCLHSAHSPHIPCYFPSSHSKSTINSILQAGLKSSRLLLKIAEPNSNPFQAPLNAVQNLSGCPRSEFNAQVQPLTQVPTS